MEELSLLCAPLETLAQLHAALRQVLCLPDYYGENFDALYDCLTERGVPTHLEVRDLERSGLGEAGCVFRQVLLDAAACNPNFCVSFTQTPDA